MEKTAKVIVSKNGPYIVSGNLPLDKEIIKTNSEGIPVKWVKGKKYPEKESYELCRCGGSKNKPFCDGTHHKIGFNGAETAGNKKYLDCAEKTTGPNLVLTDFQDLCASARFCHIRDGVWNLIKFCDDPKIRDITIEAVGNCPSGRLVLWDSKTGKPVEPKFEPSISLIEDPGFKVSGPIWVKGGVSLESIEGVKYEKRNRMTLCRCGQSKNKPFCDGSHIDCKFNDGDNSLKK
ncbi:Iron-binding zinc finger CDGSH type [Candidatus Tiddalikarchaeum anstoanum]|nr:Iron-binding zinc finger CDGSH type [Candidatus Tiddalikarchaeum anstoanum]